MSATRIFDTLYAARFLALLQRDFTRWDAYRLGIIDRKGNIEKKPETAREKKAFTSFHKLIATVKVALDRVPGATSLASVYGAYKAFVEEYEITENDSKMILEQVPELSKMIDREITEAVVAGDAGGNPDNIAKGKTSGAVTSPGPKTKRKKKTFKEFIEE